MSPGGRCGTGWQARLLKHHPRAGSKPKAEQDSRGRHGHSKGAAAAAGSSSSARWDQPPAAATVVTGSGINGSGSGSQPSGRPHRCEQQSTAPTQFNCLVWRQYAVGVSRRFCKLHLETCARCPSFSVHSGLCVFYAFTPPNGCSSCNELLRRRSRPGPCAAPGIQQPFFLFSF